MKVKVSAPGKLMLAGEHAVVYGFPCLVTAVDKRLSVTAEIIKDQNDIIHTPQVKESKFVAESLASFKKKFAIKNNVQISTNGDFSHTVGLGSSSAVTVATFKALDILFEKKLGKKEIFDMSYEVTLKVQGVGSGFDIAAATYGGILYFVGGGKIIEPLETPELPLVVGYSGIKADTPKIVQGLRARMQEEKNKIAVMQIFEKIAQKVEVAREYIKDKTWKELGAIMTENHYLLRDLEVSTDKLDAMVDASIRVGAWGAKLSGAGGGDCMIALTPPEKIPHVEAAIVSVGGEIIKVKNNTEGVRVEK